MFKSIIEHATDAVVVTDTNTIEAPEGPEIIYVNDSFVEMTGYTREEVVGKTPRILQGEETDREELDKLKQALKDEQPGHAEMINYRKNGEKFWTSISIFPVKNEDSTNIQYWIGIKRDVTKERRSFEELKTMLQELHHRVKNNLAIVSALIELQAMKVADTDYKNEFLVATTRIKSIAEIHELLYKQKSLTHVNVGQGIKELTHQISETFQHEIDIKTQITFDGIDHLNVNQAVPLSLIINEVITNSLNHAFKDLQKGTISIHIHKDEDEIVVRITDNGRGFPEDFSPSDTDTTGMVLINILTKQLNGAFEYTNGKKGATFKLHFTTKEERGSQSGF